jgi:hypothetical protein
MHQQCHYDYEAIVGERPSKAFAIDIQSIACGLFLSCPFSYRRNESLKPAFRAGEHNFSFVMETLKETPSYNA